MDKKYKIRVYKIVNKYLWGDATVTRYLLPYHDNRREKGGVKRCLLVTANLVLRLINNFSVCVTLAKTF